MKLKTKTQEDKPTINDPQGAEPPQVHLGLGQRSSTPEGVVLRDKPKKMITCPDCGRTMPETTFRYKHINVCSKPKVVKAKPIEQLIEEKKAAQQPIATPKAKPKAKAKQLGQEPTLLSQSPALAKPKAKP